MDHEVLETIQRKMIRDSGLRTVSPSTAAGGAPSAIPAPSLLQNLVQLTLLWLLAPKLLPTLPLSARRAGANG